MDKKESVGYLNTIITVVATASIFLLPLVFFTGMTDFFIIPKQVMVVAAACILLICWGLKSVIERKILVVVSPINIPLLVFAIVVLISAIISPNRYDSLIAAIPLLSAIVFAFVVINSVRGRGAFSSILSGYILGGAATAL